MPSPGMLLVALIDVSTSPSTDSPSARSGECRVARSSPATNRFHVRNHET
jgi:hypothetical protein